jgi:hypothetical protein
VADAIAPLPRGPYASLASSEVDRATFVVDHQKQRLMMAL